MMNDKSRDNMPLKYKNTLSFKNKLGRFIWSIVYTFLFRPFPLPFFHKWRRFLLKLFGCKIGKGSKVHASVKIWAPWNLEIGQRTVIGPLAIIYNPAKISIGNFVTISQYAHLCTASHDFEKKEHPLIVSPIEIKNYVWIAADSFISMGVCIGEGAIVGARTSVYKDVESWVVVGGNPAKIIKKRKIENKN